LWRSIIHSAGNMKIIDITTTAISINTVAIIVTVLVSLIRLHTYREVRKSGTLIKNYILDSDYWKLRSKVETSYLSTIKAVEYEIWFCAFQTVILMILKIGELNGYIS